jgi:hypothetical protein
MVRRSLPILLLSISFSASAAARTFEDELRRAEAVDTIAKVAGPFLQQCGEGSSLRDLQCRAIRTRMQHRVESGTFVSVVPAVRVGAYDNTHLNFPVSVIGCLTCDGPATLDRSLYGNKPWYVTAGKPRAVKSQADGKPDFVGLELRKIIQPVGPSQVESWMRKVLPNLKVQMVYQVNGDAWPQTVGNGLSAKLVAYRLYNQCTGNVLVSEPASGQPAPVAKDAACGTAQVVVAREEPRRTTLPERLSPNGIRDGMGKISTLIQECYDRYQVPGLAEVAVTVNNQGVVIDVAVRGRFKDSPTTGQCLIDAVKKARFGTFKDPKMNFQYRWFLR